MKIEDKIRRQAKGGRKEGRKKERRPRMQMKEGRK